MATGKIGVVGAAVLALREAGIEVDDTVFSQVRAGVATVDPGPNAARP